MYHVSGIVITVSLLYLLSYLFYRTGIFTRGIHRKIWNSLLAVAFLFTAIVGILTALQINYKWNIPLISSLLKWHVETGICLGIIGIFHLIWHFSYYKELFSGTKTPVTPFYITKADPLLIVPDLFVVGFTSTSVQILLIRELLNISGGYELIAGIFLSSWLMSSALGAHFAGRSEMNNIPVINIIFSVTPLVSLLLMIILSRLFLETGETPSLLTSIIYTILFLIPFCIASGFTFIKLLSAARAINAISPGKSFSVETTGGILAGLLLSVLTSGLINTYKLLLLIVLLTFSFVILNFYARERRMKFYYKLLVIALACIIIFSDPDHFFRQLLLPGIEVTATKDTPYGNITEGVYSGEKSIYYNQRLLSYNDDVTEREEDIHYAMLQKHEPEKVLIISGFIDSRIKELLKYPVKEIHFIERDPMLSRVLIPVSLKGEKRLFVENKDAFSYIKDKGELFDVAILLLPPPSTLSLNRFYTLEFFKFMKNRLAPDGVFMCSPGPADTYLNKESVNLYSSIFNSMSEVFTNVLPVAGNKLYFIASDNALSANICDIVRERAISNVYVGPDYLDDDLIRRRSDEILSIINRDISRNRIAYPIACFHFQSLSFSRDLNEKTPIIILLILLFALPVISVSRNNLLMYFSASALAGFEIIILLILQLAAGNMYQLTGLVLAALMSGLALGAGTHPVFLSSLSLRLKSLCLLLFYVLIALSFNLILLARGIIIPVLLILILTLIPSYLTGYIFNELTQKNKSDSATGNTYTADLVGSASGFILISIIMVPAFGIMISIISLALLIFTGILIGKMQVK
jgi:spermidine synthase